MGFYERVVFNAALERSLDCPPIHRERTQTLAPAAGEILEVGVGTGLNFENYPRDVRSITAVCLDAELDRRAVRRAALRGLEVRSVKGDAMALPFPNRSFDVIVCTFLLCSVRDPQKAVEEFSRVLRPDGKLLFLEHVLGPRRLRRAVQRVLDPLSLVVCCGCSLVRESLKTIVTHGFAAVEVLEHDVSAMPFPHRRVVRGIAVPRN